MKYLLKTTDTYRVDTLEEVERLRDEMEQSAWFNVSSFSYTYKYKPKLDEEYYVVTVKKNITAEDMPDRQVKVSYEVDV
jgi:hypothetical protein